MDDQLVVSLSLMYDKIEISYSQANDQHLHYDNDSKKIIRVRRDRDEEAIYRERISP